MITALYTDGACTGNPGPGGWGVVVYFADGTTHELGGHEPQTTNNRMEMQAAIAALIFLSKNTQREPVILYTDSEYLKNGITKWIQGWKKRDWHTSNGRSVLNQDLWKTLDDLTTHQLRATPLEWRYVRGHAGNPGNERCDQIARAFAKGQSIPLKSRSGDPAAQKTASSLSAQPTPDWPEIHTPSVPSLEKSREKFSHDSLGNISQSTLQSTLQSTAQSTLQPTLQTPIDPFQHSGATASMSDFSSTLPGDSLEELPRPNRVAQLRDLIETLRIADEVARKGYLISSAELADLMDVNASAVTSRGDHWNWRNWGVSRVRREGNQILWQLERVIE